MNVQQMNAAKEAMTEWLAHPQELGKNPAKIECAGTLELDGMTYYLFKYKKSLLGKWLLGVCGGYEEDELEHCGHVFSEMEEYNENTAAEKAKAMVEMIRNYWMEQAKQAEEKENEGSFVGFALLSENDWDKEQLIKDLKDEWDIDVEEGAEREDTSLVFYAGDMMAAIMVMPAPVPNQEAEQNAENNYMWPEAVEAAKAHQAHIVVAVVDKEANNIEKGKLFVKIMACCCKQKNTTGIYTSGTVFQPWFYEKFANLMKENQLPIFNWIWFGLYRSEGGICGYTYGMELFGKDEMEVLDTDAQPSDVRDFLASLVSYVLEYDVMLQDGETIGFSEDDKHAITRSEGVSLPGMTLKISYQPS